MIRLTGRAEQSCGGTEHHEGVKVRADFCQVRNSRQFGAGNLGKAFRGLFGQRRIVEQSGSVENPGQRWQSGAQFSQQALNLRFICQISGDELHSCAALAQRFQPFRRLGIGRMAGHQRQMFCALIDRPCRDRQPQSAQTAGDQITAIRSELERWAVSQD